MSYPFQHVNKLQDTHVSNEMMYQKPHCVEDVWEAAFGEELKYTRKKKSKGPVLCYNYCTIVCVVQRTQVPRHSHSCQPKIAMAAKWHDFKCGRKNHEIWHPMKLNLLYGINCITATYKALELETCCKRTTNKLLTE